jgi:hypothetical protein
MVKLNCKAELKIAQAAIRRISEIADVAGVDRKGYMIWRRKLSW